MAVVRLLAHMGARLRQQYHGHPYPFYYAGGDEAVARVGDLWSRIIRAGGDEPTEESRRLRRRMLMQAGMHDPRDGGPDEEPLE